MSPTMTSCLDHAHQFFPEHMHCFDSKLKVMRGLLSDFELVVEGNIRVPLRISYYYVDRYQRIVPKVF